MARCLHAYVTQITPSRRAQVFERADQAAKPTFNTPALVCDRNALHSRCVMQRAGKAT
jgi:hypothetical protein